MKFTTKIGPHGLKVYCESVFMGVYSSGSFRQWSNEGQLCDVELAKEFLKEEFGFESFNVTKGWSTKTQWWICVDAS